ncbi:mannose-6-phosphate isomerase, class I [Tessaracoccus flavus]|uniref:mannose-6-phosphate isomerase n=1 Tax=Tessaracoccus flavus TaxID=1610493 RepID=A0A1Q2CGX5_9ACTN|nr:mannose-6-phosphate isomerase, class I [Tessaracoccus flavus]AQP45372.1 mannose-6-phosphate isomerase, class I [Tessaracoccus flavus]SDY93806.1 mannose-6-phosphate isomerase, type 1 [Tessaracoccus flavus]
MWRMRNPRMDYAWGSAAAIPEFLGEEPTGRPVAEVWMGAHPKAPSSLVDFHGADVPLDVAIRDHPEELLGADVLTRFGPRLPFLVKLLAAGKPLSLQVHPAADLAAEGFAREEAAGLPLEASERTFKDEHHKPEVMIALAHTETLAGLRRTDASGALLERIGGPWARRVSGLLDEDDLRPALKALLSGDAWAAHRSAVLARCAELGEEDRAYALVGELDRHFPGDSGAAAPLMLNVVHYGPGEALFVPTGQIHAHISGFGVEVMAASDNVIRAGLTPKHIDREALFEALAPTPAEPLLKQTVEGSPLALPADEFQVVVGEGAVPASPAARIIVTLAPGAVAGLGDLGRGAGAFIEPLAETRAGGRALTVSVPAITGGP